MIAWRFGKSGLLLCLLKWGNESLESCDLYKLTVLCRRRMEVIGVV